MIPEQVWDEADCTGCSMWLGRPAGSAVPLVWAHAEYLKLLRSALDGKVFDRIDPVYARYCSQDGRQRLRRDLEIYSQRRPIQKIREGSTLRILDESHFEVMWTDDDWQTRHMEDSRGLGSAGFSADIVPGIGGRAVQWTLHWPEQNRWLGRNVEVKVVEE
jgi:glucoamylase